MSVCVECGTEARFGRSQLGKACLAELRALEKRLADLEAEAAFWRALVALAKQQSVN